MALLPSIITKTAAASLAALLTISSTTPIYSNTFPENTRYEACFTPGNDCTTLIVQAIESANQSIYLQAYSFTSKPIARAISAAHKKGIQVIVVLDKSQSRHNKYSAAKYLVHQDIPVWIDYSPAIAHNKVIIIDEKTLVTGSFNFTRAAQMENAENVLVIHDPTLAKRYLSNFLVRKSVSKKVRSPRQSPSHPFQTG